MKTVTITCLFLISLAVSAHGFGIVGEGTGRLELDHEHLLTVSSLDFDQDELPDLVQEDGNIIRVLDFDGSTVWSAEIDTSAVCPECTWPDGYRSHSFEGFFTVEPGHRDLIVYYSYNNYDLNIYKEGVLVVSTADGSVRHHFPGRHINAAVDFDGDGLQELAMSQTGIDGMPPTWEIWGHNGVSGVASDVAGRLRVEQNYPNPFNPVTTVRFELEKAGPVRIEVHDPAGRLVFDRPLGAMAAGTHRFEWRGVGRRGERVASGAYVLTVIAGGQRQARKMMMVK